MPDINEQSTPDPIKPIHNNETPIMAPTHIDIDVCFKSLSKKIKASGGKKTPNKRKVPKSLELQRLNSFISTSDSAKIIPRTPVARHRHL